MRGWPTGQKPEGGSIEKVKQLLLVWSRSCTDRHDGSAAVSGRSARPVPALDQSQRFRLRDRSPEVDICLLVPAAAVCRLRCVLLCEGMAYLQDVLCTQTARPAGARHPATGERAILCVCVCVLCVHRCVLVCVTTLNVLWSRVLNYI